MDPRRSLPSVDRLLQDPGIQLLLTRAPRNLVVASARDAVAAARGGAVPADWTADITARVARRAAASLHQVHNATGVVLHTNLGRAPLAEPALAAVHAVASGYSNLEFDVASGSRGSRTDHCASLLAELTGAEDALAVNNAAGALVLALNAVAEGREVLISRGELIEIGGSFRIPDIMEKSGAILREVGTTNRTHLDDYRKALSPATGAILTVHRSNFEQQGFVATTAPADLAGLAGHAGLPYLHDVGSGLLADLAPWGLSTEPRVTEAVLHGADLVLFSGDKLLGGPQAGCLVGKSALVALARKNPMARALRADKMTLAALEATLALYHDPQRAVREIPVLRMLTLSAVELFARAGALAAAIQSFGPSGAEPPAIIPGVSTVGGGSFPGAELPTSLVSVDPGPEGADTMARRLRIGSPPVVARIEAGRVVLDPRTLHPDSFPAVAAAVAASR